MIRRRESRALLLLGLFACASPGREADQPFRAGAAAVDIAPEKLPVLVSGGFFAARGAKMESPLYTRALVLEKGPARLAFVAVDSLMLPRELLDEAKEIARRATGIPVDRMMISATHTHSAPSAMGALGTPAEADYTAALPAKIAQAIIQAEKGLVPARAGWAVAPAPGHTNCRRWIRRPDKMFADPFGEKTVRAHMHPGHLNPDVVGPSGPADPDLSILSIETVEGAPLSILANFSMHYFGTGPVSADYAGVFCRRFEERVRARHPGAPFVAIFSQGTSGDLQWMDFGQPRRPISMEEYTRGLVDLAWDAREKVAHRGDVTLAMAEAKLPLRRRVADEKRLAWARGVVEGLKGRDPKSLPELYALEQILIAREPGRELKLQAIRVGDLGIATMPNEVYGITGLKVKARSPLRPAFVIELANGADGYIPPPEQHALGGYTTWAARTAGLEVEAEPRILEAVLRLLEEVSGRLRRPYPEPGGAYAEAVRASRPAAYWRMDDFEGSEARGDGGLPPGVYEGGAARALPGPDAPGLSSPGTINRCVHFAGGRLRGGAPGAGGTYTVELWLWNGLPDRARAVTGMVFSRGRGDRLGIGGTSPEIPAGALFFSNGNPPPEVVAGKTPVPFKSWCHVVLVRAGLKVDAYLDGRLEFSGESAPRAAGEGEDFLVGGGAGDAAFEGKIDEAAIYARALRAEEVARHFRAASGL
jgi:hypothetical protein